MDAPWEAKGRESNRPILSSTICSDFDTVGLHENVSPLHQRQWQQLQNLNRSLALLASSSGVPSLGTVASSPVRMNQHFSWQRDFPETMSAEIVHQTPQAVAQSSGAFFPHALPSFEGPCTAARSDVQLSMPVATYLQQPLDFMSTMGASWSRTGGPLQFTWPLGFPPPPGNSPSLHPPRQLQSGFDNLPDRRPAVCESNPCPTVQPPLDDCKRDAATSPKQGRKRRRSLGDGSPAAEGSAPRCERLDGESRLVIDFESFGELGKIPQTFGRERWILPNGLRGRHISYRQKWRFETIHNPRSVQVHAEPQLPHLVCVTWRITHVKTNQITERTETEDEAENRFTHGWTIATKVFLDAMAKCAERLRAQAEREEEPLKKRKLGEAADVLDAKGFSQGPLMFGLRHRSVQEFFQYERSTSSSRIAEEAS